MARLQIPKHKRKSLFSGLSDRVSSIKSEENNFLLFSLKYFDRTQGQDFCYWESNGLLSQALETIKNYCSMTPEEAKKNNFNVYGNFPPTDKTVFYHPKHVPEDAIWCSMHIQGKECIAGHLHRNVFYVVFLDIEHKFYISKNFNP